MNKPRYDILRAEFLEVVTELIRSWASSTARSRPAIRRRRCSASTATPAFRTTRRPYKTPFFGRHRAGRQAPSERRRRADLLFPHRGQRHPAVRRRRIPAAAARLKAIREHVVNDATGFSKMLKNKHLRATYGDLKRRQTAASAERLRPGPSAGRIPEAEELFRLDRVKLDMNAPEKLVPQLAQGFKDATALVNWLRGVPQTFEEET
jgi:hypothetical protein